MKKNEKKWKTGKKEETDERERTPSFQAKALHAGSFVHEVKHALELRWLKRLSQLSIPHPGMVAPTCPTCTEPPGQDSAQIKTKQRKIKRRRMIIEEEAGGKENTTKQTGKSKHACFENKLLIV